MSQSPLQRGLECLKAGKVDEAIAHLERACEQSPGDYRAFNYLGVAYAQKKLYDRAIGAFNMAVHLRPDVAAVHYNLGLAYEADGLTDRAREEFERALELNPSYENAKQAIQRLEEEQRRRDESQSCARHTDEPAVGHCSFCYLPVCAECKTVVNGRVYCKACAAKLK